MVYAQPRDCEYPPYLLKFLGTPGERHVENLKVSGKISLRLLVQNNFLDPSRGWLGNLQESCSTRLWI